jgi:hypothetical protein
LNVAASGTSSLVLLSLKFFGSGHERGIGLNGKQFAHQAEAIILCRSHGESQSWVYPGGDALLRGRQLIDISFHVAAGFARRSFNDPLQNVLEHPFQTGVARFHSALHAGGKHRFPG